MKFLIIVTAALALSNARAEIPQDCAPRIVASDTLIIENPANFAIVSPANLSDPNSLLSQHVQYLNVLLKSGEVLETGATMDLNGNVLEGTTILATNDLERAKQLVESDPFVVKGVVRVQYKRFNRCTGSSARATPASLDAKATEALNSAVVTREIKELVEKGNLSLIPELVSKSYVDHTFPEGPASGYDGIPVQIGGIHQAFSNLNIEIEGISAFLDLVIVKTYSTAIQTGPFFGMPASGKPMCSTDLTVFRLRDGLITEHWDKLEFVPCR